MPNKANKLLSTGFLIVYEHVILTKMIGNNTTMRKFGEILPWADFWNDPCTPHYSASTREENQPETKLWY